MTEPQHLEELTARLRKRIATAPRFSYTAERAADQLANFERPSCTLTDAQKIAALTTTLRDFQRGLQFTDPVLEHPGDRKRDR
jgi:hypothetical protein